MTRESIFSDAKQILCVFPPFRVHPRWEKFVAGDEISRLEWSSLSPGRKLLLWKSFGEYTRDNPRSLSYMVRACRAILLEAAPHARVKAVVFEEPNLEARASLG